jgi:hypothetical protein
MWQSFYLVLVLKLEVIHCLGIEDSTGLVPPSLIHVQSGSPVQCLVEVGSMWLQWLLESLVLLMVAQIEKDGNRVLKIGLYLDHKILTFSASPSVPSESVRFLEADKA